MRLVVLGAGAVGASIGGLVADAGHEVLLVARGEHARVLRVEGLRLARPDRVLSLRLPVSDVDGLRLRADDVLLVSTKLQHSADLLTRVAALPVAGTGGSAGEHLPAVCAQNGVAGERIALRRFARVQGVCVMLPASHLEPGRVAAEGAPFPGSLDLGRYPDGVDATSEELAAVLRDGGFLSTARPQIMPWKRAKLLNNLGNALTVLAGPDLHGPVVDAFRARLREEGLAAFAAAGLDVVPREEWEAYRGEKVESAPVEGVERAGGSSWQSAQRRAGSVETDHLNGEVVLLGRTHGVPTPANALLQREANALVLRGDPPGGVPLEPLLASLS